MTASSLAFLAFAILIAALHAIWSNGIWRAVLFCAANLLFVASFTTAPKALLPFACFLGFGYFAVRSAQFFKSRGVTAAVVIATLALFCWLKKYWFLSFVGFLPFPYLVIGLSYAFFRVMGMIIDARTEPSIAAVGPIKFFNFAMNFPTMIAGPIDRYQEFSKPPMPVTLADLGCAIERITIGFFKVLVLSSLLSGIQTAATGLVTADGDAAARVWQSLASFGVYPIYLYFNFSGYSDIVIGIGRLFGKKYPENFDAPFSSFSFIEFWSRWHMTLSNWLKDYVYTPFLMTLMKANMPRSFDPYLGTLAYFVTFFLIGIWHGSTIVFAIYGLLLALGVSINKLHQTYMQKALGKKQYKKIVANQYYRFVARGLTYTWYSFCMICFWANGETATRIVGALGFPGMISSFTALLVFATVALNLWEEGGQRMKGATRALLAAPCASYLRAAAVGALVFGCVANAVLTQKVDADIIYQAF